MTNPAPLPPLLVSPLLVRGIKGDSLLLFASVFAVFSFFQPFSAFQIIELPSAPSALNRLLSAVQKSASPFPLPASRFPLSGSRFPLPASRFPLSGSRFPLPAFRFPVPGSRILMPRRQSIGDLQVIGGGDFNVEIGSRHNFDLHTQVFFH